MAKANYVDGQPTFSFMTYLFFIPRIADIRYSSC